MLGLGVRAALPSGRSSGQCLQSSSSGSGWESINFARSAPRYFTLPTDADWKSASASAPTDEASQPGTSATSAQTKKAGGTFWDRFQRRQATVSLVAQIDPRSFVWRWAPPVCPPIATRSHLLVMHVIWQDISTSRCGCPSTELEARDVPA